MHVEEFRNRPKNSEISQFTDRNHWTHGTDADCKLIDGGVCAAWEKVVGEKQTRQGTP
jgi:hypothetical protein